MDVEVKVNLSLWAGVKWDKVSEEDETECLCVVLASFVSKWL